MKAQLSLLFLSLLAGKANAFQPRQLELQPAKAPSIEKQLVNQSYGFHFMAMQAVNTSTCAAVPVMGCQCAFCTQLRNAGSGK